MNAHIPALFLCDTKLIFTGEVWLKGPVYVCFKDPLCLGSQPISVTVHQCDEEEKRTEGDGSSEHRLHQEDCPAPQQEHMDKQPERS